MPNTKPVPQGPMKKEPAQIVGIITGIVTAVIALAIAYGADISEDQKAAILGMVAALAPVISGIVTRSQVFAPSSVQRIANKSASTGDATIQK